MSDPVSHAGRFIWRELMTTDAPAARSFYSALFDWTSSEMDMGMPEPYVLFGQADREDPTAGCMKVPMEGIPSHWLDYITVDDVDAGLKQVVSLGGKAVTEGMDIPDMGRFAVVEDSNGAVFALFTGL